MNIEIITIFVLAGVCGYFIWMNLKLLRELSHIRKTHEKIREKAAEKAEQTIESARGAALRIISEAKIVTEDEEKDLKLKLKQALAEKIKGYETMINRLSQDVERNTEEELDSFRKALRLETIEMEKNVSDRIEAEMDLARKQVEEYKALKIAKLDDKIYEIIKDVATRIVGRVVGESEQEGAVRRALEEAKNEHVL